MLDSQEGGLELASEDDLLSDKSPRSVLKRPPAATPTPLWGGVAGTATGLA